MTPGTHVRKKEYKNCPVTLRPLDRGGQAAEEAITQDSSVITKKSTSILS